MLAGRSADGKTVQVLIGNYEIPERDRKAPLPAFVQYRKGADHRNEIEYRNNAGYALAVTHLPWGKGEFSVKRYRITKTENWAESETFGHWRHAGDDQSAPAARRGAGRDSPEVISR